MFNVKITKICMNDSSIWLSLEDSLVKSDTLLDSYGVEQRSSTASIPEKSELVFGRVSISTLLTRVDVFGNEAVKRSVVHI